MSGIPTREEMARAFDARHPAGWREKLLQARVAVAGLGGLGSNIALMLARSGVGHLLLVDCDVVDSTHLNRQAYGVDDLGVKKTRALERLIREASPYTEIETADVKIDRSNAAAVFGGHRYVCEAFDKAENKAMLTETLLAECPGTIIVSGIGMAGFGSCNDIRTEKRFGRLYVCGDASTDIGDGIGLAAPRVAVCAGHQANTVIRLILGLEG